MVRSPAASARLDQRLGLRAGELVHFLVEGDHGVGDGAVRRDLAGPGVVVRAGDADDVRAVRDVGEDPPRPRPGVPRADPGG